MIKIMFISTFVLCLLVGVESLMFKGQSCKVDGEEGKCIDIYNCDLIMQEVKQAQNITEAENNILRKLRKLTCGFSRSTALICCTPAMQFGNSKTTASLIIDPFDQGLYVPDPDNIIPKPPADIANHINFPLLPRDCGKMDINKKAINEMSWTVLLSYQDNGVKRYLCTGTLINEWYVLTAAHCVVNLGSLKLETLVLGEYDLTQDPDCKLIDYRTTCALLKQEVIPAEIIPHFGYSPKSLQDDIALIRLKEPAIFSDSMQPICLPTTRELLRERMEGRVGMTAGWGTTEDALQTPTMTTAEIAIKSNQDCQRVIGSNIVIHDSQFCAGGGDSRQCVGDSGGPLFYFRSIGSPTPQYIQHGIVSFGFRRCTDIATPGVFTRVASYMEWILNNIRR